MKLKRILLILSFSLLIVLTYGCKAHSEKDELSHEHGHNHEHPQSHKHDTHEGHNHDDEEDEDEDEEDYIIIDEHKAEKLGITADTIRYSPINGTIKVTGEIFAPPSSRRVITASAPGIISLSTNVAPGMKLNIGQQVATISGKNLSGGDITESLRISYEAAKRELERLTPLHEKGVISTKEYNAAKTEFDKAKASLGSNRLTEGHSIVSSPGAGTLASLYVGNGDYVEAGQIIGVIGDNSLLTLRADLPKRYHSKSELIKTAFVIPPCGDCPGFIIDDYNGRRLNGDIAVNEGYSGFLPVYFTFNNPGSIEGNGYVEAYLILNENHNALAVPTEALIEQQGQWFVFVKIDEDCYEKRAVSLGEESGDRVEIKTGLSDNEVVVTKGVTFVKLAESTGVAPEGHAHSH